jgi:uncharacterized coiled-coil DUF342 family protein
VNRGDQGPLLLALAGTLLLLAVVAYAISDAASVAQRRGAVWRNREALREQAEQLAEDRKALNAEMDRISKVQSDFSSRQDAIMESLKRLKRANAWSPRDGTEDL